MALTERTRIREVHIVQNDSTLQWASCQVPITEILRDGVVIQATYGNAQPLAPADLEGVLSPAFIDITNERDAANAAKAAADAVAQAAEAAKVSSEEALVHAQQRIEDLQAQLTALEAPSE